MDKEESLRFPNLLATTLLLLALLLPGSQSLVAADPLLPPGLCFAETEKCVRGLFYAYWTENGGLSQNGLPISDEFNELNSGDNKPYRVQYFERVRFEYHPEKVNTPFVVQSGLIGREQFLLRYPKDRLPTTFNGETCFDTTNRCISGPFNTYWQQKGGLALFGYPVSDEFEEVSQSEGKIYKVQYFERVRFEYHAESVGTAEEVQLGLLGREYFNAKYPKGPPDDAGLSVASLNVYAAATTTEISPALADIPARVYVPNELGGAIDVIDPLKLQVVDRYFVGSIPHHVTPSWDMSRLLVNNMGSSSLTQIEPRSGKPIGNIPIRSPYNLYYTLDGSKAIIAAEPLNRLDFYDAKTWAYLKGVNIPSPGIDHMDMSANGNYLIASTEFGGVVVKVDTVKMELMATLNVGGLPVDVRSAPDGAVFYVANQARHGVSIVDPVAMKEIGFLPTGTGAHGLVVSRDAKALYVANRLAGTISVIDFESRSVKATWTIGGSPDMLQVSPDGSQLWASGRLNAAVYVVDTNNGKLIKNIPVGPGPHGLSYFPQPGRISVGHNGVYR